MRKFKFKDREFEMSYNNDIAPVLLAKAYEGHNVDIDALKAEHKDVSIYTYTTNTFNEETGELSPVTYYYTGAKAINSKNYKDIVDYDSDFPPKNMLIETILQVEHYKKKIYTNIKNHNCSMIDLINDVIEDILHKYQNETDEDYISIDLYDEGGWSLDFETEADDRSIEKLITSIRLVQEVN